MTAEEKVKWLILRCAGQDIDFGSEAINKLYEECSDADQLCDAIEDVRASGEVTNIPAESSRHYESVSKAAKLPDGSWVGWTYWYGGGKYGEPEAVEWIGAAYDLEIEEEKEVILIQRKFKEKK